MIKIFLSLGAIASLGGSLLPNRGIERSPITSNDNITYHVGDIWRVSWSFLPNSYDEISNIFVYDSEVSNTFTISRFSLEGSNDGLGFYPVPFSTSYDFSLLTPFDYLEFHSSITDNYLFFNFIFDDFDDAIEQTFYRNDYHISQYLRGFLDIIVLDNSFQFNLYVLNNHFSIERIKEGGSYTPPQKSNLYRYIYDFYYSLFEEQDLTAITISGLNNMPFDSWLCHTLTIITLITGIFILFLLLRWIFKVVSGFILLK